ncbi:pyrroline-5-carboxylate reductase [Candidatus Poribacteria bacterium]|nr:pyrroline-5-carboxylate reductase [Candidatus Poribacteria bacterium]
MSAELSSQRVGFIGVGFMGEAILRGAIAAGGILPKNAWVYDIRQDHAEAVAEGHGARAAGSYGDLVREVDWVVFSAKPQNLDEILPPLADALSPGQWVLSIAAGVSTERLAAGLPDGTPVVRVMPNLAASVGEAATAICAGARADDSHTDLAEELFATVGRTVRVEEKYLDAVTGLSGSGPAFMFLAIEAMADAGVQIGLTFEQACLLAAQTALGAAKVVQERGVHPAVLKTQVTSPGGTTAAGLQELEAGAVRAAFAAAVRAAAERSRELGGG